MIPWAQPNIGNKELNAVKKVFKSDKFTMGKNVELFEKKMSKYCDSKFALAVSNGTVALDIALKSVGVKPGDEVIVPAVTYFSSASSVSYQSATPVFVDIDINNFCIDPYKIEKAVTKKTKAIIYIDYGGIPAEYQKIKKIAKKYKLMIINDAAQSLGSSYNNKKLGSLGDISTMSFHMAKILTTVEGGMIFTNNKQLYSKAQTLRNIGEPINVKYNHHLIGTNARMTEISAAIGLEQLKKLDYFIKKRNEIAKLYINKIKEFNLPISLPKIKKNVKNSYFFFPILIKNRDNVARQLKEIYNIDTRIAYPMPIYRQRVYSHKIAYSKKSKCPTSEQFCSQILNLPIYPSLKFKDVNFIIKSLKELIEK